jgi:ATP phosphoribosyltransferase
VTLRLGIPQGSAKATTIQIFRRAGFAIGQGEAAGTLSIDDAEIDCLCVSERHIARYVCDGTVDVGVSGQDWTAEHELSSVPRGNLTRVAYFRTPTERSTRCWLLAVKEESPVRALRDLEGGTVATELVRVTKAYFEARQIAANVELPWGTEEIVPTLLADAAVVTAKSTSARSLGGLRILDTVIEANTELIASREAWSNTSKRAKIEAMALLLNAAMNAEVLVGLLLSVQSNDLAGVLALLPNGDKSAVASVSASDFFTVNTIVAKCTVRDLIPRLKAARAAAIIEYPLNKAVL